MTVSSARAGSVVTSGPNWPENIKLQNIEMLRNVIFTNNVPTDQTHVIAGSLVTRDVRTTRKEMYQNSNWQYQSQNQKY